MEEYLDIIQGVAEEIILMYRDLDSEVYSDDLSEYDPEEAQ